MDIKINMKELAMNNTAYEDLFFKIEDMDDDDNYDFIEEKEPSSFANLSPRKISSDDSILILFLISCRIKAFSNFDYYSN